jgi:steroid delta-isomerase-like uncharacterized protein
MTKQESFVMSASEYKALFGYLVEEAWNKGNLEAADQVFSASFTHPHLASEPVSGPARAKQFIAAYRTAFPDIHIQIEDQIAEQNRLAVRCRMQGTHAGELMGIPPTGKRVDAGVMLFFRFEEGKIAEEWIEFNQLSVLQQIGAIALK